MKVILNADVPNLGEEGDIREVKRGYARNFLIPRDIAMPYNKQSAAIVESRRAAIEKRKEEKRRHALSLKEQLESLSVHIHMAAGGNGRLFGAVTSATIAEELEKLGITIERKRIEIPEHTIKASGGYRVRVRLYGNEEALLRVLVNQEEPKADSAGQVTAEATSTEAVSDTEKAEPAAPEQPAAEEPSSETDD